MKRARSIAGLLLAAALQAHGQAHGQAPDPVPPGCEGVAARAGPPLAPEAVHALVRDDATTALQAACSAWPGAAATTQRWLLALVAAARATLAQPEPARAALQSLAQHVEEAAEPPAWRAQWHLASGQLALDETDYARAARHFEQALALLQADGATRSRAAAQALLGRAFCLWGLRDLAGAERLAGEAESVLAGIGLARSAEMGDVLNLRSVLAHARQDLAGSARLAQAELALARERGRGEDPELLHAHASLITVLSQLQRWAEADEVVRSALAIIDRHPQAEPSGRIGVFSNQAVLYLDQGRIEEALLPADRAVAATEAHYGTDTPRLLSPLLARGGLHLRAGRYAAAQADLQRALQLAGRHRASAGPLRTLRVHELLATLYLQLGEADLARQQVQAGLKVAAEAPQLGYWRARLLRRQGLLDARAGRHDLAEPAFGEAHALLVEVLGRDNAFAAQPLTDRCQAQLSLGGATPACDEVEARLPTLSNAAPGFRFRSHAVLAQRQSLRGDAEGALAHHLAALAAAEADGGADPRWAALDALAQHLRQHGQPQGAVLFGKQALAAIEALRREAGAALAGNDRSFLLDKEAVYRRVAGWLAEDDRLPEALQTLRLLKEEEFFEYLQRRSGLAAGGPTALALTEAERALLERWPALQRDAQREADFARRAAQVLREWQALPALPAQAGIGELPVPAPGELRVHALAGPEQLTLFFVSRAGASVQRVAWDRAAQAREVGQLLAALGRGEPALAERRALHARLGAPLEAAARAAGARRIVLAFDGVLRYLPLAALDDGRGPLGSRYTVVHHASAADSAAARAGGEPAPIVAMGVSRALQGQPALPGVAREVCAIVDGPVLGLGPGEPACAPPRGVVRGQGWLNERFTWDRLAEATARGGTGALLHVGTHFDLRPGHVGRSTLLLGDGSRVTLDTLAQLDFGGQALVTLSACETGLGGGAGADGREVEGLNLLILRRGAGAVLATLWRVDDESTSVLMREFYRELARTDPAEALRRAQAVLRADARWAAPFHWAAFYVTAR